MSENDESYHEDSQPQFWEDVSEDEVTRDLQDCQNTPLKIPDDRLLEKANKTVRWLLYSIIWLQCYHLFSGCAVEHILLLFYQLFSVLSSGCALCRVISTIFPSTLYSLRQYVGFDRDDFMKYVVCPNCTAIYRHDEIIYRHNGQLLARVCSNHVFGCRVATEKTKKKGKHKCGGTLVREVCLPSGKKVFYPLKVYCYKGVVNTLESFLKRPNFVDICQEWRERRVREGCYADIYDGDIWKNFQTTEDPFSKGKYNFGAMLNVDWFQPYKRRKDVSVGAIYMTIMNLPRNERFKRENVILIGIIPSLNKEPESLNTFLTPLVAELKALWNGLRLEAFHEDQPVLVKLALLCAAADIPAARKLLGFMGHGASQGCSHCSKVCIKSGGRNFGDFDNIASWRPRSRAQHLYFAAQAEKAKNLTQKKNLEKTHGYRYTVLLELEYFEPSLFCTVDPMHNLFLGTAKKFFCHWIDTEMLTRKNLDLISERVAVLTVSSDVGRLPGSIASNYSTFTAEDWKNWVLIYSVYALKGILPIEHLRLWQTFVQACRHLCQPCITSQNLTISHGLLLKFGRGCERLYGHEFITPNMHLHIHLKDSVKSYGCVYGFWLFSFERYNGLLVDLPTNQRSIEIQLMRQFLQFGFVDDFKHQDLGEFQTFFEQLQVNKENPVPPKFSGLHELLMAPTDPLFDVKKKIWSNLALVSCKHEGYSMCVLGSEEKVALRQMYLQLYRTTIELQSLSDCYRRYGSVYYNNQLYGSASCPRTKASQVVLARWTDSDSLVTEGAELRPAKIRYFILHHIQMQDGTNDPHFLAVVDWYKTSTSSFGYEAPITVWLNKFQNDGPATFIPIQRIVGRCAWRVEKQTTTSTLVVCPLTSHIFV